MLKLSLDAIEIIDAIDRGGSFAAAAEALHKVPSTISYTVSKLEEQLGFDLFARRGPRVSLTPAGRELLTEGRWLLRSAADLESRLRRIATGYESELRLVHDSLLPAARWSSTSAISRRWTAAPACASAPR
jgi:DNA-binding transcriptional LysR family regulator